MLFVKMLFAIALGGILWQRRAMRVLNAMNFLMMMVVVYNIFVITYTL